MQSNRSEWAVHGHRSVYTSPWVSLDLVDVEPPGRARYEHHLVKVSPVVAVVLLDGDGDDRNVLLMWRHRFATGSWSWEIPSGIVEPGEDPEAAALREVLEETGYAVAPDRLTPLAYIEPISGMCDAVHHLYLARSARRVADPVDTHEADRIEWVPLDRVQSLIDSRRIVTGVALTGLLQLLARGTG
ncbi:NUDIX hydrolase [Streptomyces sp. NPDC005805]|uniref:NUDIX hydrolase n=1 Tax=Streptomyces sp. NPDC005805 TaxID=3157068 RepID=UPI0033E98B1A